MPDDAEPGILAKIAAEVGQALLPLRDALASPTAFAALLRDLGWSADVIPQPMLDLGAGLTTLYDGLQRLLGDDGVNVPGTVPTGWAGVEVSADDVARVVRVLGDIVAGIRAIATAPASAFPAQLNADGFAALFHDLLMVLGVEVTIQPVSEPTAIADPHAAAVPGTARWQDTDLGEVDTFCRTCDKHTG